MGHSRLCERNRDWSMRTGQAEAGNKKYGGTRVRNAGEESVLIYRTSKLLGGVFWPGPVKF